MLLPIAETAHFGISKDKLILRVPELNDKEHEFRLLYSQTACWQRRGGDEKQADSECAEFPRCLLLSRNSRKSEWEGE
jgi:hypothetical protein